MGNEQRVQCAMSGLVEPAGFVLGAMVGLAVRFCVAVPVRVGTQLGLQ